MADYGPQLTLARLYRKTSAKGGTYFRGRLGMTNVALLKSKETSPDGDEIWNLVLSEAPKRQETGETRETATQARAETRLDPPQRTPMREREIDDEIPF